VSKYWAWYIEDERQFIIGNILPCGTGVVRRGEAYYIGDEKIGYVKPDFPTQIYWVTDDVLSYYGRGVLIDKHFILMTTPQSHEQSFTHQPALKSTELPSVARFVSNTQ